MLADTVINTQPRSDIHCFREFAALPNIYNCLREKTMPEKLMIIATNITP